MSAFESPGTVFVSGFTGSGKTTLIELLVPRLRSRGLRIGTIKHAHEGFEIDRPGRDSWRHTQAGAEATAIVGPTRTAWVVTTDRTLTPSEAVRRMGAKLDLVLAEGFKREDGPRILLMPGHEPALELEGDLCRLGSAPLELDPSELQTLEEFCTKHMTPAG